MNRGVLYIIWNNSQDHIELARRSVASVKLSENLPCALLTDPQTQVPEGIFDHVIREHWDTSHYIGYLPKILMGRYTPFEETLYLDADTVVMDKLDYAWAMVRRFGLCMAHAPIYARHANSFPHELNCYQAGVIFFKKSHAVSKVLFPAWEAFISNHVIACDQLALQEVVYETGINPFTLPPSWNHRTQFGSLQYLHGALKIMHWRGPIPLGAEIWKIAFATGKVQFASLEATSTEPLQKHFVFNQFWFCTECEKSFRFDNRCRRHCSHCRKPGLVMIHPSCWKEFDQIESNRDRATWVERNRAMTQVDHIWGRPLTDDLHRTATISVGRSPAIDEQCTQG